MIRKLILTATDGKLVMVNLDKLNCISDEVKHPKARTTENQGNHSVLHFESGDSICVRESTAQIDVKMAQNCSSSSTSIEELAKNVNE
jgi:hypothetical protein